MASRYPLPGDSAEVRNLITIGLRVPGAIVTCTTDHGRFTGAGFLSYHRRGGTDGNGLAVDIAGSEATMVAVFKLFETYKSSIHELIHSQMGYSIKDGKTVGPIDKANHYNHVHISIKKGTKLALPPTSSPSQPPVKVQPMFNPAIGPFVAQCVFVDRKGRNAIANLTDNGQVYCTPGDSYAGAPYENKHNENWQNNRHGSQITDNHHHGYLITDTAGEKYNYNG